VRKNAPIPAETALGWTVLGKIDKPLEMVNHINFVNNYDESNDEYSGRFLHSKMEKFFSTEDFGVKDCPRDPMTAAEKKAVAIAESTLVRLEDRYEIGLLGKHDPPNLPESRSMAMKRLKSVERKMELNPDYAARYCENMQHYIDAGFLRKLSPDESQTLSPK